MITLNRTDKKYRLKSFHFQQLDCCLFSMFFYHINYKSLLKKSKIEKRKKVSCCFFYTSPRRLIKSIQILRYIKISIVGETKKK